jgi:hypothetical protein
MYCLMSQRSASCALFLVIPVTIMFVFRGLSLACLLRGAAGGGAVHWRLVYPGRLSVWEAHA